MNGWMDGWTDEYRKMCLYRPFPIRNNPASSLLPDAAPPAGQPTHAEVVGSRAERKLTGP